MEISVRCLYIFCTNQTGNNTGMVTHAMHWFFPTAQIRPWHWAQCLYWIWVLSFVISTANSWCDSRCSIGLWSVCPQQWTCNWHLFWLPRILFLPCKSFQAGKKCQVLSWIQLLLLPTVCLITVSFMHSALWCSTTDLHVCELLLTPSSFRKTMDAVFVVSPLYW